MLQPHNPVLDAYRNLSGNVLDRAGGLLTKSYLLSDNEATPEYLRQAKDQWQFVPSQLAAIETAIEALGEVVLEISFDSRRSAQAKADDLAAATATARAAINAATSDVLTRVTRILDVLRTAAYPARPGAADAAQEARLAGVKGDLRMVWDSVKADGDLLSSIIESLQRSLGDGDDLQTWVIASTRWPEDYLRSRSAELHIPQLQAEIAAALDAHTPRQLTEARRAYSVIADGRDGLPLLEVLFNHLDDIVTDLASWRGGSY